MAHDDQIYHYMSGAYQRFASRKRSDKKKTAPKLNLHKISFDDSEESERSDIPNIFLDEAPASEVHLPVSAPKPKKRPQPPPPPAIELVKQESRQQLKPKRVSEYNRSPPKKNPSLLMVEASSPTRVANIKAQEQRAVEEPEEEEIFQIEEEVERNTGLSIMEILRLYMGQFLFRQVYPLKKSIYVNNNNAAENQLNQQQARQRLRQGEKELLHFDNSLVISPWFFTLVVALRNVFGYFYIWAWLVLIIFQRAIEKFVLKNFIQYGTETIMMIVLLALAVLIQLLADFTTVRKRRDWEENELGYHVYHHNGHMAQWKTVRAPEIQPGHIFRVIPGDPFPADAILLHCEQSLVRIKERHIISQLVEHPAPTVMKECIFKGDGLPFPFTGCFVYQISNPEFSNFQVGGKLTIDEPNQATHNVTMLNFAFRGSLNSSQNELTCMALETGIDSIMLKNLQYPFQHRKTYEREATVQARRISEELSEEMKEYEDTFQGAPLEKKVEQSVRIFFVVYLIVSALGVFIQFLYSATVGNDFYLAQEDIAIWKIAIYHFTNHIIFIPVLLIPMFKLYVAMEGALTQRNLTNRCLQIMPDSVDRHRRTSSIAEESKDEGEELLDNKKIVFPVNISDYNLIPELNTIDTIVTSIDTFRDEAAFTLHSIKVKEITHNFMTQSLENEAYGIEDIDLIKYFMSVALLTTEHQVEPHYETGIHYATRKYLDIRKQENSHGQIELNNGQFRVKHLFHIYPIVDQPYKVTFVQPIVEQQEEDIIVELEGEGEVQTRREVVRRVKKPHPERVLVLVRGKAKVILDKTYGKQIELTEAARKLEEEKGYHVELLAKTSVSVEEAAEIRRAYTANNMDKTFFYRNLERYISKVEPMGMLLFVNQFYQKKIGESLKNPILNRGMGNDARLDRPSGYGSDVITAQQLPKVIILAPVSQSSAPQFESLHTITNLLTNPYLFNFSLGQVGEKIVHDKPNNIERMMDRLDEEGVLVWDGWEQLDICYTLDIMRRYGRRVMLYLEKDEHMFLMKEADVAVRGGNAGYDNHKYADITLSTRASLSYLYLLQMIKYDAQVARQALLCLFFTQLQKYTFYVVLSLINFFYTRGTAIPLVASSLFTVVELVLLVDVFYYLNWGDSMRGETYQRKDKITIEVAIRTIITVIQAVFIALMSFYSLEVPYDSTGTSHSYQIQNFVVVFSVLHVLVFEKLFNHINLTFSLYKLIVLLVQLTILYLALVAVSLIDTNYYAGILWYFRGKAFMTAIGCIWVSLSLPALRSLLFLMKKRNLKRGDRPRQSLLAQ